MGNNCICFKPQGQEDSIERSTGESNESNRRKITNSTNKKGNSSADAGPYNKGQPVKNVFKKKRGEGYIPPHIQAQQEEELPKHSLATYSLLNQKV